MRRFGLIITVLASIVGYMPVVAQNVILSTESGKTCNVGIQVGALNDNLLEVTFNPVWLNSNLSPVVDKKSVICFEYDKVEINQQRYLKLVNPQAVFGGNSKFSLTFRVDERFPGGDITFSFPFMFAENVSDVQKKETWQEFIFKRPKELVISKSISRNDLVDKVPPRMTFVTPKGLNDGLKPIVDTSLLNVQLLASDLFGIKSVVINNKLAKQLNDSIYSVDLPLEEGYETRFTAQVTDNRGNSTSKDFSVECRKREVKTIVIAQADARKPQFEPTDVDLDIPKVSTPNPHRYALVIGNEDYTSYQQSLKSEMNVEFAERDASVFKDYAIKVMGVPNDNILFLKNAKAMEMIRAINQINAIIKNTNGQAEVIVYYAGHGFPDEITKEPYLIPVDVSGADLQFAVKLTDFYKKLTEYPSKRVTVFLDACFSGGGRDQGLLAARGVKVKPKENLLNGNLVVFSASSGEQSSLPYREKGHGIFTYYLLKKMKESSGELSYNELSDYISREVSTRSVLVNNKEQNPQTNVSASVGEGWKTWMVR